MASSAENLSGNGASAASQMFVINLAASTSPMALSHPSSPELKRYTFFVSRQRQDGRDRFRLHMGYFATQDEAEALLDAVREVYPGAWAGPAPTTGAGRRGRIAPSSVVAAAVPAPIEMPSVTTVASTSVEKTSAATSVETIVATSVAAAPEPVPTLEAMSNVRDVIAQLSEGASSEPAVMREAAATRAELSSTQTLRVLEDAPRGMPAERVDTMSGASTAGAAAASADTVIAPIPPILPPLRNPFEGLAKEPEVRLVTPEDTQTLTDIRVDRQNNAPLCFAVQLAWSVTPIDVGTLPHLAIFDAYTLYNVEGNRQGRKWYGLRLGFFSDPSSASQVANYVRSNYQNVAVVPVVVKERDRARGGAPQPPPAIEKISVDDLRREKMEGFELITDDRPMPAKRDLESTDRIKPQGQAQATAPVAPRVNVRVGAPARAADSATKAAPGKPLPVVPALPSPGKATGKRVVARRRAPQIPVDRTVSAGVGGAEVLESTLEILGASTLSLEEGGRVLINDGATHKSKSKSGGRFSKLLGRLGRT
jgi:hypothetical protein